MSVAAQHGRAQARESEIFGRLTTSVACRGIEGERAWWACYYWRIYFCDDRTGRTRDLTLSLSAFFVSPSALSFFLGASLGRLLPSRGLYFAVIFRVIQCPCHGPPSLPLSKFICIDYLSSPILCPRLCMFCSSTYSAFPSLFNIFGNLQSMIWTAGCIN